MVHAANNTANATFREARNVIGRWREALAGVNARACDKSNPRSASVEQIFATNKVRWLSRENLTVASSAIPLPANLARKRLHYLKLAVSSSCENKLDSIGRHAANICTSQYLHAKLTDPAKQRAENSDKVVIN